MDLSLVPLNELIDEAERRCEVFIAAYELADDKQKTGNFYTFFGKGEWLRACALANVLNNDCVNNWSGELKTLKRINEEENEDENK